MIGYYLILGCYAGGKCLFYPSSVKNAMDTVRTKMEHRARVNTCNTRAHIWPVKKQPQAYVAFPRKVDESAEAKVDGDQIPSDVFPLRYEGNFCVEYARVFPSYLPEGLPPVP